MHKALKAAGGFALATALLFSATTRGAQQGGGGAQGAGAGGPQAGGTALPAAESRIPNAIDWPSPQIGDGPFMIESAVPEHRNLRVVVVAKLEQPWSAAWLPDGSMLVTERPGRLRIIRNGTLDPKPIAGVPQVRASGLQGLMDVVLHPRFAENRYVYLSYHKPVAAPPAAASTTPTATNAGAVQPQAATPQMAGETVIARGVWNGSALTDVRDIFATGATGTESSRIGFGTDGMLYMTVSAPGYLEQRWCGHRILPTTPVRRFAFATTAASRRTTRFSTGRATSRPSTRSVIGMDTRWRSILRQGSSG